MSRGFDLNIWDFIQNSLVNGKNEFYFDIGDTHRELLGKIDKREFSLVKEVLFDFGWIRLIDPMGVEGISDSLNNLQLVAYDVVGGFYFINCGYFETKIGTIYYLNPESLEWMNLNIGYKKFLVWLNSGDIDLFYKDERWFGWEEDVKLLPKYKVFEFNPPLWSQKGSIKNSKKRILSLEEMLQLTILYQEKFG